MQNNLAQLIPQKYDAEEIYIDWADNPSDCSSKHEERTTVCCSLRAADKAYSEIPDTKDQVGAAFTNEVAADEGKVEAGLRELVSQVDSEKIRE